MSGLALGITTMVLLGLACVALTIAITLWFLGAP